MEYFDVFVAGFEVSEDRATRGLMQVFGLGEPAARIFVRSVPRMGKRRLTPEAADRYVRALRAVGALVERRPSKPSDAPQSSAGTSTSLPPPASLRPSQLTPTDDAQRPLSSFPTRSSEEVARNIPAAARIPADFAMAESHSPSDPAWQEPSPLEWNKSALRPDQIASAQDPLPPSSSASSRARVSGITLRKARWYNDAKNLVALACLLIAAGYFAVKHGASQTEHGTREQAWHDAGIDPGSYEVAGSFLAGKDSRFEHVPVSKLEAALDGIARAGAPNVWVVGIKQDGHERVAHSLLIELPNDDTERRTIIWQHLRSISSRDIEDQHQRYLLLEL